uniref:NR LBD domain-containing protein n=1 Tax=Caenorhabditis japonica TaxID=281687 RepID=A0A8R1EAJ4_CAEJA
MRDRLLNAMATHIEKRFPFESQSYRMTRALKISLMLPSFSHIGQVESTLIQQLTAADLHQLSGVPMEICAAQQSV